MSDAAIRQAAFGWLTEQVERHDDVLPRSVLHTGFQFRGTRVPLVGPQGIFKPRLCELPLSVLTACDGPYDDRASHDGRFLYAYRGRDPKHRDNEGLRTLMQRRIPLIYFLRTFPGRREVTPTSPNCRPHSVTPGCERRESRPRRPAHGEEGHP